MSYCLIALGKGRMSAPLASSIVKVPPFEKEAIVNEVRGVIEQALNKTRQIKDTSCKEMGMSFDYDLLDVTVNSNHYYIFQKDTFLNGKKYFTSLCQKKILNDVTELECVSRSEESLEVLNEEDKLVFFIKYNNNEILVCPSSGKILR
jgi:hypothetical protein